MSFIDDMKIGKKLIGGFLVVVLILVVVALIGYVNMGALDAADTSMYQDRAVPLAQLGNVDADFQQLRAELYRYIYVPSARAAVETMVPELRAKIKKNMDAYRATLLTPEEKKALAEFDTNYAAFTTQYDATIAAVDKNDMKSVEAALAAGSPLINARTATVKAADEMMQINVDEAKKLSDANTALYQSSSMMMLIATLVGAIIAIVLALYLSKSITGPLEQGVKNIREMSMGHLGNRLRMNRKDEIGELADTMDQFSEDLQKNVVANLQKVAAGDCSFKMTAKDSKDEITPALIQMTDAINRLTTDANMLSKAAIEGKLDTRADASKHQGDYKKVVEGVNATLDAVIGPLNVAAEYVDRISKGDIPKKITDNYNGDFNEIKNNLNNCIDNINALVADAGMLRTAAIEGKLATRADASKHQGDYKKIVQGVDDCLDAVIGPLNVAADYVDKISKGAIPAKITDPYNGDFNVIKNNLNNCIDNINRLVADADLLSKAAVEGKLDTRADANKHQGDYKKIVKGVDDCLDAVIGPLNVAAEYVDRISKGDIPAKITDQYNGDFNEIKNNLNNCIDNINRLVADAGMLAKAAEEGKLATRADASKHQGDYQKIVQGVNNTLDGVINPVNEAMRISNEYAKQNFVTRVDENLRVAGDFIKFKEALNNVGIAVGKAVQAVNKQTTDLSAAAEEANASINEVASGASQIAQNAAKVNENADKSNSGIAQVLKAMEDLSSAVEEVTSSMENVSNQSKQATEASKTGAALAESVEKGMGDISGSTDTVYGIVKEIEKQMADITKIVVLIRDLANQTNLLALNAAIEAARAGDAGRGFAVVASEVKSLAEESRGSAEKIEQMITELNKATKNAASATEDAKGQVAKGAEMSAQALQAFRQIKEAAEKVNAAASEVAAAAEEQAATVEEITASVHEVRNQIEGTAKEASNAAAASEEATASINEVSRVVENVNKIVDNVSKEMAKFTV